MSRFSWSRPQAVLLNRRPVTAFTPLRFAAAHLFLAAREILFLPSSDRRPFRAFLTRADDPFLPGPVEEVTVLMASTIVTFAAPSKFPKPFLPPGNPSMTLASNASTLFSFLRAFL